MHLRDYKSISRQTTPSFKYERRKKLYYGRKEKIFLSLLVIVLGLWGYVLLFSSFFTITNVQIDGLRTINRTEIESILARESENIFRFSQNHAWRALNQAYFLDDAQIKKI